MDFPDFDITSSSAGRAPHRFRRLSWCAGASRPRPFGRVGDQKFGHAQQIQSGDHILAGGVTALHSAIASLAEPSGRLHPAEDLLDAFADSLADGVGRAAPDSHSIPLV